MQLDNKNEAIGLASDIINTMFLLAKQLKLYVAGNRLVELTAAKLHGFFELYFLEHKCLELTVARHGFIYADGFIERSSKVFEQFAYQLFQHGVSTLTFNRDVTHNDISAFLELVGRAPSESWEEGGLANSLKLRDIESIVVREMAESDFTFIEEIETEPQSSTLQNKSPLWDRFAYAAFQGLAAKNGAEAADSEAVEPGNLADLTNRVLAGMSTESQQKFSKGLSDFLAFIQFEKITQYRARALAKLTDFINRISPDIRKRIFSNIFNLEMKPAFTEEFCSGLSDEIIIEILESSSRDSAYVPPVILKLLGKIARDKGIVTNAAENFDQQLEKKKADISRLFQRDDFEQYVPEKYREALVNIIRQDSLPKSTGKNFQILKTSLEESQQEKHATEIILKILKESVETQHLKGLDENLANTVFIGLQDVEYKRLLQLWRLCSSDTDRQKHFSQLYRVFNSAEFTERVVDGITTQGKKKFEDIVQLIVAMGKAFVEPLLDRLATETNRSHRMLFMQILQQLDSKQVFDAAVKHLNDHRWYFVRNLIYLLRNMQNTEMSHYFKPLINHSHPKIMMEALRICLPYGSKEAIDKLVVMLDDKDAKTVETAISLAPMVRSREVNERLFALLQDSTVFDYRFDQKKAIIQALADISPEAAMPAFANILASKSLVHSRQHERLKNEIIKALERFDHELLAPVIQGLASKTSKAVQSKLLLLQRRLEG